MNPLAQIFLTLFENRLSSKLAADENASHTLNLDNVVREVVGPFDPHVRHSFKLQPGSKAADLGVAVFRCMPETLQVPAQPACP